MEENIWRTNLKLFREEKKITQHQLVEMVKKYAEKNDLQTDVSQPLISGYESGKKNFTQKALKPILAVLEHSLSDLFSQTLPTEGGAKTNRNKKTETEIPTPNHNEAKKYLEEIFEDGDEETKTAIFVNLKTFANKVWSDKRVEALETEVRSLREDARKSAKLFEAMAKRMDEYEKQLSMPESDPANAANSGV